MSLPNALASISFPDTSSSSTSFSLIMAIATLFIMLGKFVLGRPTDLIGGEKTLLLSCAFIAVIVYSCSIVSNTALFGLLWIALNFTFSSSWGAVGSSIRKNYPESEWGTQLSVIAAGSRFGSMFSAIFYGKVLKDGNGNWRLLFKAASIVQVIALVVAVFLRNTFKNKLSNIVTSSIKDDDLTESIKDVITRVTKSKKFWLMLIGKMSLMVVGQFISFIPLFLITGLRMPAHIAASSSSVFSLGSLFASILVARFYQKLQSSTKNYVVLCNNLLSSMVGVFLTIQTLGFQMPVPCSLGFLFLWGGTWAAAFYSPPGIVALELGGPAHAALLTNVFDAAGYLAAAVFSYYATSMGRNGQWTGIMASLTLCSTIASITMLKAMKIPHVDSKKVKE